MTQHTVLAFWIVGPSAIGSVKGIPSSMMSAGVNYTLAERLASPNRTSATRLHSEHDVGRFLRGGETSRHIRDKGRLHPQSVLESSLSRRLRSPCPPSCIARMSS